MIKLDRRNKTIVFYSASDERKDRLARIELPLASGFECRKCKRVLLAYFIVGTEIPVWKYEEKESGSGYYHTNQFHRDKNSSDFLHFRTDKMQGIEAKDGLEEHHYYDYGKCQQCRGRKLPIRENIRLLSIGSEFEIGTPLWISHKKILSLPEISSQIIVFPDIMGIEEPLTVISYYENKINLYPDKEEFKNKYGEDWEEEFTKEQEKRYRLKKKNVKRFAMKIINHIKQDRETHINERIAREQKLRIHTIGQRNRMHAIKTRF